MYKILAKDGRAKRAQLETVHGTIQTPVFMNVGTVGAMKGAVATTDMQHLKTQVMLCNTYHLHVRPGDKIIRQLGALFFLRTPANSRSIAAARLRAFCPLEPAVFPFSPNVYVL